MNLDSTTGHEPPRDRRSGALGVGQTVRRPADRGRRRRQGLTSRIELYQLPRPGAPNLMGSRGHAPHAIAAVGGEETACSSARRRRRQRRLRRPPRAATGVRRGRHHPPPPPPAPGGRPDPAEGAAARGGHAPSHFSPFEARRGTWRPDKSQVGGDLAAGAPPVPRCVGGAPLAPPAAPSVSRALRGAAADRAAPRRNSLLCAGVRQQQRRATGVRGRQASEEDCLGSAWATGRSLWGQRPAVLSGRGWTGATSVLSGRGWTGVTSVRRRSKWRVVELLPLRHENESQERACDSLNRGKSLVDHAAGKLPVVSGPLCIWH